MFENEVGLVATPQQFESLARGSSVVSIEVKAKLDSLSPQLVPNKISSIGSVYKVVDCEEKQQLQAQLKSCFVTSLSRLATIERLRATAKVSGSVAGTLLQNQWADLPTLPKSTERLSVKHVDFAKEVFPNDKISDDTELFVSIWMPVSKD